MVFKSTTSDAFAGVELRALGHELRHLVQHALDAYRARVLEPFRIDGDDRASRVEVPTNDARAGHGDFLEILLRLSRISGGE
jgi:hypothetical protein